VTKNGHSAGTATMETIESTNVIRGKKDSESFEPSIVPRLLDLHNAARYMSLSYWTVRDLVNAGQLPAVKVPCMFTWNSKKKMRVRVNDGRSVRRVLLDRLDLDRFIEQCKGLE
jgi:hypothetical protein